MGSGLKRRSFFKRALVALCAPLGAIGVMKTPAATGGAMRRMSKPFYNQQDDGIGIWTINEIRAIELVDGCPTGR